ncbi:6-phosphogluconolactonase [Hoeflea sp. J2-29]|uniref:6-phosphogluconolactonase n=2 Tax=Hoeflea ulvae TaxID=2983764 RepID=A0ABT3YCE1_9HYPH|nr:6-phosphogluconolactonase [Hoeflea ulvae]MCY0093563.1 6-phosphogluconolactonase [Hoeflea ulvae]
MTTVSQNMFDTGAELATALARKIADRLSAAIAARGQASLAVSGGSTPKALFAALSKLDIDWAKVTVTLVDERMVGPENERSNHRLAKLFLLKDRAAAAKFLPLFNSAGTAEDVAAQAAKEIDALALPFDVVVLGMGTDGHTASFFPGGSTLADVTDPACGQSVMAIEAPGAGEPRLTLTLPRIVDAGLIVLHIEGDDKRSVLARALENGPAAELPVRAVLRQAKTPVELYWAP